MVQICIHVNVPVARIPRALQLMDAIHITVNVAKRIELFLSGNVFVTHRVVNVIE